MSTKTNSSEELARGFMVQEGVLRVIGIWPISNNHLASTSRWTISLLTQISSVYLLSLEIYRHCLDLDDTMDAFIVDLSSIISCSKLLILRLNSKHTYALINSVTKDWSAIKDSRQERIMTEYCKKARIVSLMILYLGYASGLSFVVKALPFDLMPFEMFQNSANASMNMHPPPLRLNYFLATYCVFGSLPLVDHVCVLLWQAANLFVNSISHCANDGLFFSLTMHLCGQFEVLKMNLAEIEYEKLGCSKRIALLVKRHCRLGILANDLEQSFNMVILVQLLMSALLICVQGLVFLICLNTKNNFGALKSVVLMATLLIQLYLYAYAGDTLQSRTEEIAQAAYESLWYRSRGHVARDLVLIINRGNSPYRVTAGKFLSMNLFTFKEILKTSASYISVLKAGRKKRKRKAFSITENDRSWILSNILARMKTSSKEDFAYAMTPLKFLSWPLGTWPLQDYNWSTGIRTVITLILMAVQVTLAQSEMYLDSTNPEKNMDNLVFLTCGILCAMKVLHFRVWCTGLVSNFISAVQDYKEMDDEKRVIVRRHAYFGRMACAGVIVASYIATCLYTATSVFITRKDGVFNKSQYPMQTDYVMRYLDLPHCMYYFVFCLEYTTMLLTSTGNLGSDSLFYGITFHLCGQIEILKLEFGKLVKDKKKTQENFRQLIKRHIYLLNLANMLNDTISSILVVQLFISCLLICTSGFQIILALNVGNIVLVIKAIMVVATLLTQLFAYSYVGEYLKNQLEGIGKSVYFCFWYDYPRSVLKDIVFVIMRAQDPVCLTAGNFFIVNMQTYMSILKTSASYLSVLRVMVNS